MKDFLDADIGELMSEEAEPDTVDDDYKALLKYDDMLMNRFRKAEPKRLSYPAPVRKRHIR